VYAIFSKILFLADVLFLGSSPIITVLHSDKYGIPFKSVRRKHYALCAHEELT